MSLVTHRRQLSLFGSSDAFGCSYNFVCSYKVGFGSAIPNVAVILKQENPTNCGTKTAVVLDKFFSQQT